MPTDISRCADLRARPCQPLDDTEIAELTIPLRSVCDRYSSVSGPSGRTAWLQPWAKCCQSDCGGLPCRNAQIYMAAADLWRHRIASGRCYRTGTGLVDVLKRVERRDGQSRLGSGNSAKLHHAFFISDRRHRSDHFF